MRRPLALSALWLACQADKAPLQEDLGDACRSARQVCLDDETVKLCRDRRWTALACDEACAEHGDSLVSIGCLQAGEAGASFEGCACEPEGGPECTPGEATCDDEETLRLCSEHATVSTRSCRDRCAEGPIPLRSAGCEVDGDDAWCNCTADGVPCDEEGAAICADEEILATCTDGRWEIIDCAEACGEDGSSTCQDYVNPARCPC